MNEMRTVTLPAIIFTLFVVLLSTGCDEMFQVSCETDADCSRDGDVCFDQVCTSTCSSNADCFSDEVCAERPGRGTERVCQESDIPGGGCDSDFDCPDRHFCESSSCVHDGTCSADTDCFGNEVCFGGYCRECADDFDCPSGEFCDSGFCLPDGGDECWHDDDCALGEFCDGGLCLPDGGDECWFDDECAPGEFCDAGTCVQDGTECFDDWDCPSGFVCDGGECLDQLGYHVLLIEDRTSTVGRCNDTTMGYDTAGAKLMYVELYEEDGTFLADGTAMDYEYGTNTNFGDISQVLDGSAPEFSDACPTDEGSPTGSNFRHDQVVAIGCDGWVALQFFDLDANPISFIDGDYVAIGEFGPACNDTMQSADDAYDVSICTSSALSSSGFDINECLYPFNDPPLEGSDWVSIFL